MKRWIAVAAAVAGLAARADEKRPSIVLTPADLKWEANPIAGQRAVLEGDPSKAGAYTTRVRIAGGQKLFPHTHPNDEHATVISGAILFAIGDKWDEKALKELPAGSYIVVPAGVPHYAMAKGETIYQTHGVGPAGITFVNPGDLPRAKPKPGGN